MLSVHRGHSVRYLTDEVAKAREGYYTGAVAAGEPPGLWWGKGAETLGLVGEVDADGFLRTGTDVSVQSLQRWQGLGREPLPFETSVPRIFAAGDVRRGSMKRVAAAVGEGSSAVASVHRALADLR